MYQLFAVIISFAIIPILIRKKLKLSYTLLITATMLAILSNLGAKDILDSVSDVFINSASRTTILTVFMVSILGGLIGHYKILDKIVYTLEKIIKNKKNILMIIPGLIGFLIVPGGALLSAPFINNLGKDLKLSPERRAAINLIFRHIAMFIMPYSTGILIVASSFPEINIMKVIGLNSVFISLLIIVGYFLYIKDIQVDIKSEREDLLKNSLKLIVLTSPIYIPVIINLLTGLPFYITLIFSILIVYLLGNKHKFIENFVKAISWHTVLTVVAILIIKEIILRMDSLLILFTTIFNNNENIIYTLLIFLIISIFFGFITGNQGAALAVILPMIGQLNLSENVLYTYIYFVFGAAFIGYYFSPLHLCQAFTVEVMGAKTGALYKEYSKYAALMFLILMITFFMFRLILV